MARTLVAFLKDFLSVSSDPAAAVTLPESGELMTAEALRCWVCDINQRCL